MKLKSIRSYLKSLFATKDKAKEQIQVKELVHIDELLNSLIKEKKIPGLAITVFKKEKVFFQKGYGYADLEAGIKVDPKKTIFRIASISKNIAATALAQMVKDRIIDLDGSFYHYVPYFPKKKHDFTIRQLASHTAGIRSYKGKEYGLNKPYSIKDSLHIFKDDALLFEPGTDYHYNSYDWVLISLAMQEACGVPFEEYVQEKVLTPLDLQNTFPENVPSSAPSLPADRVETIEKHDHDFATFYSKNRLGFRKAIPVNNRYKLAGGGYVSTSEDIAKFGQAYLNKGIINDDVIAQFISSVKINGNPTYYGLGWQVSEDKSGRPYFGHIGNGVGGYSNLFIYPQEQMVFSILINCTNPGIQEDLNECVIGILNNS
ncbi:serine hydrolase domain-containing protein [Maribacter arenosus]|uniref:Beta-lactamase family protein n=1 Tax=Maribacter arenosus TaxID=1854708 RepID=A0ABR7VF71_9FLAO|nr:serine hydrolase domain-containing protein [Maribacter arenosus]MBD0852279.1 beta-lactamase family protein [Maribacter arenosus]